MPVAQESFGRSAQYADAPYATDTVLAGRAPEDARRITVGRLFYVDLPKAVRKYGRKYSKDERETLRTDALLWIIRQDGSPPLRREWIETDSRGARLTQDAWNLLRRALRAAEDSRELRTQVAARQVEESIEEHESWGAYAERVDVSEDAPCPVPDASAERVAAFMGLPLAAGRALIFRAWNLSPDIASEEWGITRESVQATVSKGAGIVRKRYPESRDLLSALRDAGAAMRQTARDDCETALEDFREGWTGIERAEFAAREYLSTLQSAPVEVRAVELAARRAVIRAFLSRGITVPREYALELAGRIAQSALRLVPAERARTRTRLASAPIALGLSSPIDRAPLDVPRWLRLQRAPIVECSGADWEARETVPRAAPVPREWARVPDPPAPYSDPPRVWWTDRNGARHTAPARSVAPLEQRAAMMHVDAWIRCYGADGREPEPMRSGDYRGAYMEGEK